MEIKFRGMSVNGEWFTGLLCIMGDNHYISNSGGVATAYQVRPDTIGQFIGFVDRKGVEVFTGDIIQNANGIIGEVFFDEDDLQYKIKENSGDIETFAWYNRNTYHFLEVIGNIYEDNNLIK